jgi:hypothetical protein
VLMSSQIFGPVVNYVPTIKDLGTSNAHIYAFVDGSLAGGEISRNSIWAWVDVRDLSRSHLLAYVSSDTSS